MKKFILITVTIFLHQLVFLQVQIGSTFRSGFNRVGLYFDQTLNIELNSHQLDAGVRFYGPDYVFETNAPGLSLGYQYNITSSNFYFSPGLTASVFHENKNSAELLMADFLLIQKLGVFAGDRWSFFYQAGIGAVLNKYKTPVTASTLSYINYEFALGIKYYLRLADNH